MKRIVSITQQLVEELRQVKREEDETTHGAKPGATPVLDFPFIPNCLIVEDDDNDAELSERALRAMGAEVSRARTGDEAIRMLQESIDPRRPNFHIIFLDLNLVGSTPNGTGDHVLKFVRSRFPTLHVVVVSGYIDEGTINFMTRDPGGYIGVIRKPLEQMDVAEIFQKHRLNAAGQKPS